MDARPLFNKHQIPLTNITFFKADSKLINTAHNSIDNLFSKLSENISVDTLAEFGITAPKCITGTIASGDQFIADKKQNENILHDNPETMAVEMEGAAVAQVCHDYQTPFVVMRTISDNADDNAHIDFPRFIDKVAKHYSEEIIQQMFKQMYSFNKLRDTIAYT